MEYLQFCVYQIEHRIGMCGVNINNYSIRPDDNKLDKYYNKRIILNGIDGVFLKYCKLHVWTNQQQEPVFDVHEEFYSVKNKIQREIWIMTCSIIPTCINDQD